MKNNKLFQYIVMGIFIFFIIIGAILFSTYKSKSTTATNISITMWGTLSKDQFNSFTSTYFNDSSLKYTVNYTERDPISFDTDLVEALASGVGPDAIILPEDKIIRYANKIYAIPYTAYPDLQFKQTFVQEGEMYLTPNGILALPFSVDPLVMYWNRDIFNNLGITRPPTSWTEISGLAQRITTKDVVQNITRSTVALGEFRNVLNAKDILTAMIIQSGGSVLGKDSDGYFKSTLKDDFGLSKSPAYLSLQFFTNFSNPVKPEYSWNRSLPNSIDMFANGDLAIYFGFASEYIPIKNKNPNLNFSVSVLPQIANAKVYNTFGNMQGFAIMNNSTNPAGAYTVLTALTSAQAYPFWSSIFNVPSARRDVLGYQNDNAVMTIFNNSAIMSKGSYDPSDSSTNLIFQEMVESYTTGRESLDSAISAASDKIDNLLK